MKNTDLYNKKYYSIQGYGFAADERSDHKRILELLKIKKNDKVLEIGCGLGVLLKKVPSKKKIGIETNDYAIKESRRRGLSVIKTDAEKGMAFKDSSFDAIIMNEVIEHLKKPKFVLKECFRILSPGGKIIITTPVKSFFAHDLTESHFSEMTLNEFKKLVKECGFDVITQEVNGISFLYPLLENVFFKPFRLLRYFFVKNEKAAKTVGMIDSCHGLADKTLLKPLNRYRNFFLQLGLQQLILAKKK